MIILPDIFFSLGYSPIELEQGEGGFKKDEPGNIFITFLFFQSLPEVPHEIGISLNIFEKFGEQFQNLCFVKHGENTQQAVLAIGDYSKRFIITEEVSTLSQLLEFSWLGVEHIFTGYDHIMFLVCLIVLGGRFMSLIKIVTAFTIAHSITLILAALEFLSLPGHFIEAGIALSIAYVAAENIIIISNKEKEQIENTIKHRWILTFFFGLVHGFGFANVLSNLGLPTQGLVASLLAFNLGVEFGQIIIVALLLPIILWITKTKIQRQFAYALSFVIFAFGFGWFIERALGLEYMPF